MKQGILIIILTLLIWVMTMTNIKFNTSNLSGRTDSLYEVEKFNGVDYTTTPTAVDETRAIDASNYLPEGNGLVKRYGFDYYTNLVASDSEGNEIQFPLYGVKAIYPYNNYLLVFAYTGFSTDDAEQLISGSIGPSDNLKMYIVDKGMYWVEDPVNRSYELEISETASKNLRFLEYEDKLFIFTGEKVYCWFNGRYGYTLKEITSDYSIDNANFDYDNLAYIPLITTNIPALGQNGKVLTLEQPNLLTKRVRIQCNSISKCSISGSNIASSLMTYNLEAYLPTKTLGGLASIHIIDNKTYANETTAIHIRSDASWKAFTIQELNHQVELIDDQDNTILVKADKMISFYSSDYTGNDLFDLPAMAGTMEIHYFVAQANIPNYSSSRTYTIKDETEVDLDGFQESTIINAFSNAFVYDDKIFAINGNTMYNSATPKFIQDTTRNIYFPSDAYQVFGDNTPIVSAGVLNNGQMIIFKKSNYGGTNVYLRHKEYRNTVVDYSIGDIVYQYNKIEEIYPVTQVGINLECDEKTKAIQYDNKVIISTLKGIYYVNVESSTATQTYNAYELSYMIRNDLSDDLSVNYLFVRNGMLYVIRKSKDNRVRAYVADKDRYTFVDGKMQYEWWVLDDMPIQDATDFILIQEDAIYGTRNGILAYCGNQKNFYDEFTSDLQSSNITFTVKNETVVVDEITENLVDYFAINLSHFDDNWTKEDYLEFKRTAKFYGERTTDEEDVTYGFTDCIDKLYFIDFETQTINGVSTTVELGRYEIEDCELIDGNWYYTANNNFIRLGYHVIGNTTTVENVVFRYFTPKRKIYEGEINKVSYNLTYYSETYYTSFDFQKPIKAYWKSKYTDLGATESLKTTSEVYFIPETRRGGAISIGYKTAKREKDFTRRKIILSRISETEKENLVNSSQFNFADVDFTDFHFETEEFAHSYSCKRKVKNFAFIQFKFYSNEPKDSTIVKFAVKYHKTRDSRGVR